MEKTYNKFTMSSNPVKYFYEKALAPEAGSRVPKLEMYEHSIPAARIKNDVFIGFTSIRIHFYT